MTFSSLPTHAAWRHIEAREGFEVVYAEPTDAGFRIEGHSTAVEEGAPWAIAYVIELDQSWLTRRAEVHAHWPGRHRAIVLEADGRGQWTVDGVAASHLDGCLDVDLEASAFTNTFPIHRFNLRVGERADAPAAYVRAFDLAVERLEQDYLRVADDADGHVCFDYRSPRFGYEARLVFDTSGLVLDYPSLALRCV